MRTFFFLSIKARRDKPCWEWNSSYKEAYCPEEAGATELEGALPGWAQTLRKECSPIGVGRVFECQGKGEVEPVAAAAVKYHS